MAEPGEAATTRAEGLVRAAAVLWVFDLDWLAPGLARAGPKEVRRLGDFLADSCERVVDAQGVPRWRLRDDERVRVLRTVPRGQLLAALDAVPRRPDEPAQEVLEQFLYDRLPRVDDLGPAELAAVLQLQRWVGPGSGLPSQLEVESRLGWLSLLAPLRRLLEPGVVGRQDLLDALAAHVDAPFPQAPFVLEGVGGSGKSTVLARLIETRTARGQLVCYASFERTWLVEGGAWSLFDEIARQIALQLPAAAPGPREQVEQLRRHAQRLARRDGSSGVASALAQQVEPVPQELVEDLGRLLSGRRLVLVLDTLEELARRDSSLVEESSALLEQLRSSLPGVRVVAAGRVRPRSGFVTGRLWRLTGLSEDDALLLLRRRAGLDADEALLRAIIRMTKGNPLSLHLAADVVQRTGRDPARLIAIGESDIQGQLYSRLLGPIEDDDVRAVAHPGLVVRRITPEVIRDVLAGPCGIAPLDDQQAAAIVDALRREATLCEPSRDEDGALLHRPDVRAVMLSAITRATPGLARAIHKAAVRYYEQLTPHAWTADRVARREELYHRLMLEQPPRELDRRWTPSIGDELAAVIDELPAQSQVYLAGQVDGLRLDPEVRAEADDEQWRHSVHPTVEWLLERGQVANALDLLRERRGRDGRVLLPELEIEALERLGRLDEALLLAETEAQRASRVGQDAQVRDLILQQAWILERMRRFGEAWALLDRLARLDRAARARGGALDADVRTRELLVLTSLLRIARHSEVPRPVPPGDADVAEDLLDTRGGQQDRRPRAPGRDRARIRRMRR